MILATLVALSEKLPLLSVSASGESMSQCRLMPYLYQQAIISHKTGVPMMRPMFVEFPKDKSCETLDKQYMFGDSLLVAPIFKESGEVNYYVPKGMWYNLLTGQIIEGEKWHKGTFDYFSLPLLVRPNSILVLGNNDQKPDYDYCDHMKICFSYFEDGAQTTVHVPNIHGEVEATIHAKRNKNCIELTVQSDKPFTYQLLTQQDLEIVIKK